MLRYRDTIYNNYFTNQVNKLDIDHKAILKEQSMHNTKELMHLLPSQKDIKIVDLGCGFGTFVKPAMDAGYQNIKGYDISKEQVKVAHSLGINNVFCMSIDAFFETKEKVDVLVGLDIIEHFTKDELIDFLKKAKSCLKPGGKIILRTPNMDAPQTSIFAFGDVSHETLLNKSAALQIMSSVGFTKTLVYGGLIRNHNPIAEVVRLITWSIVKFIRKIVLFSSARTWHNVVFEPNLLIISS